ncbi:unnamed protein product, partial [Porites evermanni]
SGGVTSTLVLHPLDLIKIRFEGKILGIPWLSYRGLVDAVQSIVRTRGLKGLYQGLTPKVWGNKSVWVLYFFRNWDTNCDKSNMGYQDSPLSSVHWFTSCRYSSTAIQRDDGCPFKTLKTRGTPRIIQRLRPRTVWCVTRCSPVHGL